MRARLIFLFCLIAATGFGQVARNSAADSLLRIFQQHSGDTTGVQALLAVLGALYLEHPGQALQYSEQARQLSVTLAYPKGEAEATGWRAYLLEQQGKIEQALKSYQRALELARALDDKAGQGQILNNMAAIYKNQGKIADALAYYEQSRHLAEAANDQKGLATTLNNIGLIYYNQGQIQKALDHYRQSLKVEESIDHAEGMSSSLHNIGSVFFDLGMPEEAEEYAQRDLHIVEKLQDKYSIGYGLNFLGQIYAQKNDRTQALDYYQQALRMRESIDDKQGVAYTLRNLGKLYEKSDSTVAVILTYYTRSLQTFEGLGDKWGVASLCNIIAGLQLRSGQRAVAKTYALRSLNLAEELGYPLEIHKAAEVLAQIYRHEQDWQAATRMDDLLLQVQDSVQNEQTRKASLKTMLQYDYEKKELAFKSEQERQQLLSDEAVAKERLIRNFLLAGFLSVLVFFLIAHRQRNRLIQEKKRSDALLLNILPAETAEELKATGSAQARHYDFVTVLFTDFKNFTLSSEQLSAEDLVREIHFYYCAFDRIITAHGLEKIKTIGDSYMCVGGLPTPNTSNPVQAVRAALAIRDFMVQHRHRMERENRQFFDIRIGLHTGPVVAGVVGEKKFAYDIWGDTVNVAARIEEGSLPGKVNISGAVHAMVKDQFDCVYRGMVEAKNKGKIEMYFVESSGKIPVAEGLLPIQDHI